MEELTEVTSRDLAHLGRCVVLAREALAHGDGPFGSVLGDPDGDVLGRDRTRTAGGDRTRHPELEPGPGLPIAGPALDLADEARYLPERHAERRVRS